MPLFSPLKVLVVKGHCSMDPAVTLALQGSIVTVIGPDESLPNGPHDIEVWETHLTGEEWKSARSKIEQPSQRIHVCLAQPISAIIVRNALREYERANG